MSTSYGGDQITFADNSVQATAATGFGFKNRIINGAMVIDQRNAGAASANTIDGYFLDRFLVQQWTSGKVIAQQNAGAVTPPAGFSNYLGITSQSAYAVTGSDRFTIQQPIEGFNVSDLGWGTANAQPITLSFWVRSSLTGTFGGSLTNSAVNRSYPYSYTISAANTWEYKTVTIAGDVTGTWLTTNGIGIRLYFSLGAVSSVSGTAGAWAASGYYSATGAVSVVGTSGATFYITGVQLEKGSTATAFDYRPYGTELALCQRYYTKMFAGTGSYTAFGIGYQDSTTSGIFYVKYSTTMRSSPTFSASNCAVNDTLTFTNAATLTTINAGTDSAKVKATWVSAAGATYRGCDLCANNNTAAYIDMTAEL
jgi:hypothetical protein